MLKFRFDRLIINKSNIVIHTALFKVILKLSILARLSDVTDSNFTPFSHDTLNKQLFACKYIVKI